jgi:inosine/xanthosine triphosphatase
MLTIVVASHNPVKLNATLAGFQRMFPDQEFAVKGVSVESGVADQPMTDDETYNGAFNRALRASQSQPDGDYFIGLEGGLEDHDGELWSFAWMVVRNKSGLVGKGRTATFMLPGQVRQLILGGMELGDADDIVFTKSNSKQANGALGLLTGDVATRTDYYTEAVIFALIPFKNPKLYPL